MPLAACEKPRGNSPVDAYTSFSKAAQRGDYKTAYAALSQQTQKRSAARSKETSSASAGAIKDDPAALSHPPGRRCLAAGGGPPRAPPAPPRVSAPAGDLPVAGGLSLGPELALSAAPSRRGPAPRPGQAGARPESFRRGRVGMVDD